MTNLEILTRGVSQVLPDVKTLAKKMDESPIRLYLGIDPTGNELHLGHSVALRKLKQFTEAGHHVILLVGNGTAQIGDPTGRDSTRPELTAEQIDANWQNWKKQASKILDFDKVEILYNGDWLRKLDYADLIKLMSKTTVQQLLERDMFQERLKNNLPIFAHEIIYPLMQGYDSVAMNVDLEIGGTDQTFNMLVGRDLQRIYNNHEKWVLSLPLINGFDGRKMSKSYGNFVALTASAQEMYGKLMSANDDMIVPYLEVLTDMPLSEIKKIKEGLAAGENPIEAKKIMAAEITGTYHSQAEVAAAAEFFQKTVQNKEIPSNLPVIKIKNKQMTVLELARACDPTKSSAELKRLITQGGLENMASGEKLTEANEKVDLDNEPVIKMGKRGYYQIKIG